MMHMIKRSTIEPHIHDVVVYNKAVRRQVLMSPQRLNIPNKS